MFLAVLSTLNPKVFGGYIASRLLLGVGVSFLFRGIIIIIKTSYPPKGLERI